MFRHFLISLWIATLLTATVGVSVQSIYCYCTGKTSVALFTDLENEDNGCCTETQSCCSPEVAKPHPDQPCQSGKTKYVQLKIDLSVEKSADFELKCFEFKGFEAIFSVLLPIYFSEKNTDIADRAPPKVAGRALLPFIQSWLC